MTDSPAGNTRYRIEEGEEEEERRKMTTTTQKRLCDFCGDSMALLYCRADSAKLCFSCDREVHSTNQLFTKHTRSRLCDLCDDSPASILCPTDDLVLCQNCDWEKHGRSLSAPHDRRPLEGFSGQPLAMELLAYVGFEDLRKKPLFCGGEGGVNEFVGSGVYEPAAGEDNGFSDFLVWDTPSVVNLDDLIVSTACDHSFQAMGVPPFPKNRGSPCGQHRAEIIHQLRQLGKSEPGFDYELEDSEPPAGFRLHTPEQLLLKENGCNGCEDSEEFIFPSYEASAFQWCGDEGEAANQVIPSVLMRSSEESCLVPGKHSDVGGSVSHANGSDEGKPECPVVTNALTAIPKAYVHELNSQERDSALSRYKEKKKTRRYDKQVRYESRKVRAESRKRIKGRFAKIEQ